MDIYTGILSMEIYVEKIGLDGLRVIPYRNTTSNGYIITLATKHLIKYQYKK